MEERDDRFSSILRFIWIFLCILANGYQVSNILQVYFRYDVSTKVQVAFPEDYEVPKISLCFYTIDLIKWDEELPENQALQRRFNHSGINITMIPKIVSDLNIANKMILDHEFQLNKTGRQIFNRILKWGDLFDRCAILDPDDYIIKLYNNCSEIFIVTASLKECYTCFAFSIRSNKTTYNHPSINRVVGISGFQYSVTMTKSALERIDQAVFAFSPMSTLPRHGFAREYTVTQLKKLFRLTSSFYKNSYLPEPFFTGCIDYSRHQLMDKGQCFDRCLRNVSLTYLKDKLLPGPLIRAPGTGNDQPSAYYPLSVLDLWGTEYSYLYLKLQDYCNRMCRRPDCQEEFLVPLVLSDNPYSYNCFLLYVSQQPPVQTIYSQKYSLPEFLADMGSTFGVWANVSVLSVYDFFADYLFKLFLNKKKEKKINHQKDKRDKKEDITVSDHFHHMGVHTEVPSDSFTSRTSHALDQSVFSTPRQLTAFSPVRPSVRLTYEQRILRRQNMYKEFVVSIDKRHQRHSSHSLLVIRRHL